MIYLFPSLTFNLPSLGLTYISFFLFLILERVHTLVGRGAEGDRERERESYTGSRPSSIPRPWDHNLSQNQESDA